MTDDRTFDSRLEERLRTLASTASRPFDAGEIARTAVAATRPRRGAPARGRWALVLLGVALLLGLVAGGVLLAGSFLARQSVVPRSLPGTLAIAASEGLVIADSEGNGARLIDGRGPFFTPRWSPDGTKLAASAILPEDPNALLVYDAAGDLVGSANDIAGFAWSADSRRLVVIDAVDPMLSIVPVIADGPETPEVPLPPGTRAVTGVDWLPDGRIVAALELDGEAVDRHGLWILDPTRGGTMRMGSDAGHNAVQPVVSPDGRLIATTVPCSTQACEPLIRIVDVTSGQRRLEIENVRAYGPVAWAPDGRGIAYSSWPTDGRITAGWWDFARDVAQVDPWPGGRTIAEQVLQDGAGLLVTHQEPGAAGAELWRLPLDGTDPVRLAVGTYGGALQPAVTGRPPEDATDTPGVWLPPGFAGRVPAAVRDRDWVPFCGVDDGGLGDPARACLGRALAARAVAELAIDQELADGWRLATILRTTPGGGGTVTIVTDPPTRPPLWETYVCASVVVRGDAVVTGECGPLMPLE